MPAAVSSSQVQMMNSRTLSPVACGLLLGLRERGSAPASLAAYTGARRGELLNLRWRDVDGGQRIEGTTKSGRSRTVSIIWPWSHSTPVRIGPRRTLLWSALVVNDHGPGLFVPNPSPSVSDVAASWT